MSAADKNLAELPPLPETEYALAFFDEGGMHDGPGVGYTAGQMRDYARAALRVLMRQAPCPHDNLDTRLGAGNVWAKCQDCGATIEQASIKRSRKAAREFEDAIAAVRALASSVAAQGEQATYTREQHCAIREGEEDRACDDYLSVRPQYDSLSGRTCFLAGFSRGFDRATDLAEVRANHPAASVPAQAGGVAVPAGYKLVPVEPTPEMLDAAETACDDKFYPADMRHGPRAMNGDRYCAMIDAAPTQPAGGK